MAVELEGGMYECGQGRYDHLPRKQSEGAETLPVAVANEQTGEKTSEFVHR